MISRSAYSNVFRRERKVVKPGETAAAPYLSKVRGTHDAPWLKGQKGRLPRKGQRWLGNLMPGHCGCSAGR